MRAINQIQIQFGWPPIYLTKFSSFFSQLNFKLVCSVYSAKSISKATKNSLGIIQEIVEFHIEYKHDVKFFGS